MGETVEANAVMMHDTMHAAKPPINYDLPDTKKAKEDVCALRDQGQQMYFTQDAGPNIKRIFIWETNI